MKHSQNVVLKSVQAEESDALSSPLLKAFAILKMLAHTENSVSLAHIAQEVNISKPSVYRILNQLEAGGFILRGINGRGYSMSPDMAEFALDVLMHDSLQRQWHATLQKLGSRINETCNLTILDKTDVLYLDRIETQSVLRLNLKPGSRLPIHCVASGKMYLSQMKPEERQQLIKRLPLERYTSNTITDPALLEAELDRLRVKDIGIDNEEFIQGAVGLAVPVRDAKGRCCASVAMHAPVARVPMSKLLDFLPALREAADEIAATLRT